MTLRTLALTMLVSSLAVAASAPADIESLSWMAGSWEMKQGDTVVEEQWTAPAGGSMIGMGRTVSNGKTVAFEYLRIEQRGDGIFYVAQPNGRSGTEFKAVEISAERVVFANPAHDFPKRITYGRSADGSIWARVEGDDPSQAEEFRYIRAAATAPTR